MKCLQNVKLTNAALLCIPDTPKSLLFMDVPPFEKIFNIKKTQNNTVAGNRPNHALRLQGKEPSFSSTKDV